MGETELRWRISENSKTVRDAEKRSKFISFGVHYSIIIYALVFYFSYSKSETFNATLFLVLIFVYVVDLLVWHFYFKKIIKIKAKSFTINEQGIFVEIEGGGKKRKVEYLWNNLNSFRISADNSKRFMIYFKGIGNEVIVEMNSEKEKRDVCDFIKNKTNLEEVKRVNF